MNSPFFAVTAKGSNSEKAEGASVGFIIPPYEYCREVALWTDSN